MRHRRRLLLAAGVGLVAVPVARWARDRVLLARSPLTPGELDALVRAAGTRRATSATDRRAP